MKYFNWLPSEGVQIIFVLFLSFLIGLEREGRKAEDDHFAFGGVRTYPLIGLIGYAIAVLTGNDLASLLIGFAVVGAFLLMAYWHKLSSSGYSGVTSEMSALATYLIGALVQKDLLWIATAITVASVLLLELKGLLEGLAKRIETTDIFVFAKFLLLTAVILPLLPSTPFSKFQINPFNVWLVVVAVSGISYVSYVLQRLTKGRGGLMMAAVLGGVYSSTVTTVVLSRRSKSESPAQLFSGGILIASGMMYLRLAVLLALFNQELMMKLAFPFVILAALAILIGFLWSRHGNVAPEILLTPAATKNPLETTTALFFAVLFVIMLVLTQLAVEYSGSVGVYGLAGIMGVADVDPFIMSLTQSSHDSAALQIATNAILIAAASNNVVKGIYAYALSSRKSGLQSLTFLCVLAALGLLPLAWQFGFLTT